MAKTVKFNGYDHINSIDKEEKNKRRLMVKKHQISGFKANDLHYTQMTENQKEFLKELKFALSKEIPFCKSEELRNFQTYAYFAKVKTYLKFIEPEDYIEFVKLYNNLEIIDTNELNQILEVIEYFLYNLKNKYNLLIETDDSEEDINKAIDSVYISYEDNLDDYINNSINRLYRWKVDKLKTLYNAYLSLFEFFNSVKNIHDKDDIKQVKFVDSNIKRFIKKDEQFLYDYVISLEKIIRTYLKINSINTVKDSKINEIKDLYVKKLIMGK